MTIKRYIIVEGNEVIREITWEEYKAVEDIVKQVKGKDLSFYDTFDKDKRQVFPFKSSAKTEIQKLLSFLEENGYEVNLEDATVSKEFTIPAGPKKGEKSRKQTRIGKYLTKLHEVTQKYNEALGSYDDTWRTYTNVYVPDDQRRIVRKNLPNLAKEAYRLWKEVNKLAPDFAEREPRQDKEHWSVPVGGWGDKPIPEDPWRFDQIYIRPVKEFVDFWNKKSEYYRKNPKEALDDSPKHTIIISRHPVDVLRMSDFQGIISCHSPKSRGGGGSYYQCAKAEAQGHGLVAYVVENTELPEDFNVHEYEEIFADAKRNVPGITPISRLRLRKFVHSETGRELAVPEKRVYGKKIPGFLEAVLDWAREQRTFDDLFDAPAEDIPRLNEFVRYGGSYADSNDGELFNQLFNRKIYDPYDDARRAEESEEEEAEDLANQYEEESNAIQDRVNGRMDHASVYFEVEVDEEQPYVLYSGGMSVTIRGEVSENYPSGWREKSQLSRNLIDKLSNFNVYMIEEIEIENQGTSIDLRINAYRGDYDNTPDGFDNFASAVETELDDNHDKIIKVAREFFVEEGYMEPSEYEKLAIKVGDLEAAGERLFKNFETDLDKDEGEIHFKNEKPIYISLRGFDAQLSTSRLDRLLRDVKNKFLELLEKEALKIPTTVQLDLPGVEDEEERYEMVPLADLDIDVDITTKVSPRYKELSIAETTIDFMAADVYDDESVHGSFQYVKWMDENPQQVGKMLQQAYDEVALEKGLHPEIKRIKININSELRREAAKTGIGIRGMLDLEERTELQIEYLDLGDDIFISAVTPGMDDSVFAYFNTWFPALLKSLKHNLIKFGRNLLLPLDSLFIESTKHHQLQSIPRINRRYKELATEFTGGKMFMFDKATDVFELYPFAKGKIRPNLQGSMLSVKFDSIRESLLLNSRMLFENDEQVSHLVDRLVKNKKTRDLVRMMKPLDVAKVVAVNLELQPEPACKTALNLIKHAHDAHYEGLASPGIESNKEYPVPPKRKREVPKLVKFKDEAFLHIPAGKTVITPKYTVEPHQYAQDPYKRPEVEDWPYDDMTKAGMSAKNKAFKRGLTAAKDNSDGRPWKQKGNPLNPDLKVRQPGGDGAGGGGIYSITFQTKTGETPGAGNRSWSAKGTKGWNSMPGAEFTNPDEENDQPLDKDKPPIEAMGGGSRNVNPKSPNAGDEDEDIPKFLKNPPVGSSRPETSYGGRTPAQPAGYRNWMKK